MPRWRHLKFFSLLLILSLLLPSEGGAEVLSSGPPGTRYSIQFVRLSTGEVLYEHDPHRPLNPASNAKIVTAAAALRLLGPDFRFKTNFFSPSSLIGGVVHNLWIKGYGNPLLVTEEIPKIAAGLKREGLREIRGTVYYDDSYFDGKVVTSYSSDVSSREYRIMTSPLAFNFNTMEPEKPATRGRKKERGVRRREEASSPPLYTTRIIVEALQENGVRFDGTLARRAVPLNANLLWSHESPPLKTVLKSMGKFSNNFTAEQILKTLGATRFGPPGSTEKGIGVLQEYLDTLGLPRSSYFLENGSGLSKRSRIAASSLVLILSDLYHSPLRDDFISSLSISGIDGTMKRRFRSSALRGELFVKTGSLAGVVTLSGYWLTAPGGPVVFSILMNGGDISHGRAAILEEEIFTTLARRLRGE